MAISFAAHGDPESVLAQVFLVGMRTVQAAAIRVVNAALGWRAECKSKITAR